MANRVYAMKKRTVVSVIFAGLLVLGFLTTLYGESVKGVAVAVVNGTSITKEQLTPVLEEYRSKARKQSLESQEKMEVVKSVVRRHLILQQKEVAELRKSEKIRKQLKEMEDQLVLAAYLEQHVGRYLTVSDEELQAYYKANLSSFSTLPKVKAKHILLRSEGEAKAVLEKLRKGAEFSAMAKQYSIDLPMALEGGSMGTIEKGKTLPELQQVLFSLKEGEVSDVVKTRFGYHILSVEEIIPISPKPFEEVKGEIKTTLMRQKEAKAFEKMVTEIEKRAEIKIFKERVDELGG
jgi:peptidyl-prolyl cis-trans isomerase C